MTDNEFDKKGGRDSPLTFSSIILSLSRDRDEKKKHSLHFSLYVSRFDVSRSRCVRPSSREKYGFFKLLHVFFFFLPFFLSPSSFRKQARHLHEAASFFLLPKKNTRSNCKNSATIFARSCVAIHVPAVYNPTK